MSLRAAAPLLLGVLAATLAGCGSSDDGPTLSTPPEPVTTLLEGDYELVIIPGEGCGLPEAPYELGVEVESFTGPGGDELRATLSGGDEALVLEMLYARPGLLEGAVSTRMPVPGGPSALFVRASGSGAVTAAASGRAEVEAGTMNGLVRVTLVSGDEVSCTSLDHGWALRAR